MNPPAVDSLPPLPVALNQVRVYADHGPTNREPEDEVFDAQQMKQYALDSIAALRPVGGSERLREIDDLLRVMDCWGLVLGERATQGDGDDWCWTMADAAAVIRSLRLASPQGAEQRQEACVICSADEPHTGTCGSKDPRALCNRTPHPAHTASQGDAVPPSLRELWQIDHDLFDQVREIVGLKGKPGNVIQRVRELAALASPTGTGRERGAGPGIGIEAGESRQARSPMGRVVLLHVRSEPMTALNAEALARLRNLILCAPDMGGYFEVNDDERDTLHALLDIAEAVANAPTGTIDACNFADYERPAWIVIDDRERVPFNEPKRVRIVPCTGGGE